MFSERIKKIRKDLSLTQEDFSNKVEISVDTIQKWEKGTLTPRISVAESVAQKLGVSLGYLIGETERETEKNNSDNVLYFKNGEQEVKLPNTDENRELFLTIVKEMVVSHNEFHQSKINMQDNINGNNSVKM